MCYKPGRYSTVRLLPFHYKVWELGTNVPTPSHRFFRGGVGGEEEAEAFGTDFGISFGRVKVLQNDKIIPTARQKLTICFWT